SATPRYALLRCKQPASRSLPLQLAVDADGALDAGPVGADVDRDLALHRAALLALAVAADRNRGGVGLPTLLADGWIDVEVPAGGAGEAVAAGIRRVEAVHRQVDVDVALDGALEVNGALAGLRLQPRLVVGLLDRGVIGEEEVTRLGARG